MIMSKFILSPKVLFLIAVCVALMPAAFGQEGPPAGPERRPAGDDRPDMLAQLGLTPEQIQQFQRLNVQHRPLMNEAQRRMREANRELDMAIYADTVSDDDVRAKVRAFQDAQAELNRLRFGHELNIRKILTHEQLIRFREMRRRFAESRQRNQRPDPRQRRNRSPEKRNSPVSQRPTI